MYPETFDDLFLNVKNQKIICPLPSVWDEIWDFLLKKLSGKVVRLHGAVCRGKLLGGGHRMGFSEKDLFSDTEIFLEDPHVLSFWYSGNDYDKNKCFKRHLEIIVQFGLTEEVWEILQKHVRLKNNVKNKNLWHLNKNVHSLDKDALSDDELTEIELKQEHQTRIHLCQKGIQTLNVLESHGVKFQNSKDIHRQIFKIKEIEKFHGLFANAIYNEEKSQSTKDKMENLKSKISSKSFQVQGFLKLYEIAFEYGQSVASCDSINDFLEDLFELKETGKLSG